jgi:hypothetical protein
MPKDGNATERRAIVVLPPGAARRLIARGVARLPSVQRALRDGLVVVTLGTTNAYVAEELLGAPLRGAVAELPSGGGAGTGWDATITLVDWCLFG